MKPQITLPPRTLGAAEETFAAENNIVIIGANGSGKSRLGYWIETKLENALTVQRISAQRALNIPEFVELRTIEQAEKLLLFGLQDPNAQIAHKRGHRWGGQPEVHLLNDYGHVLSSLVAQEAKRDADHSKQTRATLAYVAVPESPIDVLIRVWKDVMPQRDLQFEDGKISAKKGAIDPYHGKQMSDGERVTVYLIGQCLLAPDNSIVIIDEPELHLHRSLMSRLWDKVDEECPNKLLVYITHDLEFAASRAAAKKIWIKDYDGTNWTWEEVPELEEIPETLMLELLGNRKKVIFVESEKSKYDETLYKAIYPEHHVIARGGCEKVIESTKATRDTPSLNYLDVHGIIDSDYRPDEEIDALRLAGISVINVAEVENLFCVEPLLRIVAAHLKLNPDDIVAQVTDLVITSLRNEFALQVANRTERQVRFRLRAYTKTDNFEQGLIDGITNLLATFDISTMYAENERLYNEAINNNDLEKALRLYNRKSLSERISPILGLAQGTYVELVLRLLRSEKKAEMVAALQRYTPTFL